ncbi:MAG: ATP-binding protein [Dysgonamonadaceae bacterium]|jgi:predicted AAA+ superfamily ATPase|nr:ATP-binding protein [Dysgonamonadaceae bacterium]
MKPILREVITDQRQQVNKLNIQERVFPETMLANSEIIIISGIRRCGKSMLMEQIRRKQSEQDYFINFDDERLISFTIEQFQPLYEVFIEMFGEQKTFYFDEIQNIKGWERFVRRLHDAGNKVFITGSNASMLSRELGTHLTGRYNRYELFPFSFREFLELSNPELLTSNIYQTNTKSALSASFLIYLQKGGFPLYLQTNDVNHLKYLYESIIYRDVLVRNNISNEKELLELVWFLASNVSKLSTYSSLSGIIGVKNHTTVKNYIEYLENTYLLFQLNKFDFSAKSQIKSPRKTYFIDNGLAAKLGFSFSNNTGRFLENLIFIELKRRGKELYYYKNENECDFLIRENYHVTEAIQVCAVFENELTKKREIDGLQEAMNVFNLEKGLIITLDVEENISFNSKQIEIIPAWKWLL